MRKTPKSGSIVLHIGRNKAGSTTIQDFCVTHAKRLEQQGVEYVTFGHLWDSNPDLKGFRRFEELRAYARQTPDKRILLSNEFLFGWPDEYTEDAASALASCDVKIIAYIRVYDAWLISAYAEETRRGMNMRDIDHYLEWMEPRIAAWRHLKVWGDCFGWDNIYLRDLNRASLHNGDLCSDFAQALNVDLPAWTSGSSNISPHWIELELARRLTKCNGDVEWIGVDSAELNPLLQILRPLLSNEPPIEYLSLSQRISLLELYNSDLLRIEAAGGPKLQAASLPAHSSREAVPSLPMASPRILAEFFDLARADQFTRMYPEAARRAAILATEMGFEPAKSRHSSTSKFSLLRRIFFSE